MVVSVVAGGPQLFDDWILSKSPRSPGAMIAKYSEHRPDFKCDAIFSEIASGRVGSTFCVRYQ
jgi:hypothetical protein